jgi:drug/metabolite transporter (DMT)-like permease
MTLRKAAAALALFVAVVLAFAAFNLLRESGSVRLLGVIFGVSAVGLAVVAGVLYSTRPLVVRRVLHLRSPNDVREPPNTLVVLGLGLILVTGGSTALLAGLLSLLRTDAETSGGGDTLLMGLLALGLGGACLIYAGRRSKRD